MALVRITLALFIILFARPASLNARVIEQVLVVIDREPYTLSNVRSFAANKGGRKFASGDLAEITKEDQQTLEEFITEKLLEAEVRQAGIRISEQDVTAYIKQVQARNGLSDERLKEALAAEGLTMEKYRESIRAEIEKSEIINLQVRQKVNISQQDVERFYQMDQKKYMTPERVRLRHILIAFPRDASPERQTEALQKAQDLRRRALSGTSFASLAKEHSEGAGAAEGGDIGWLTRGSLLTEIDNVVFGKMSVGEISDPIRTSLGVHLVKLEERQSSRPLPLAEVQEKIRTELYAKALDERFQKWMRTDLRRKHTVDVRVPGVVFRPEDFKGGTVDSLVAASARRRASQDSSAWSYLNPFSYLFARTPADAGDETAGDETVLSVFGVPLFRTASGEGATGGDPLAELEKKEPPEKKPEESKGFFSSFFGALNPF